MFSVEDRSLEVQEQNNVMRLGTASKPNFSGIHLSHVTPGDLF